MRCLRQSAGLRARARDPVHRLRRLPQPRVTPDLRGSVPGAHPRLLGLPLLRIKPAHGAMRVGHGVPRPRGRRTQLDMKPAPCAALPFRPTPSGGLPSSLGFDLRYGPGGVGAPPEPGTGGVSPMQWVTIGARCLLRRPSQSGLSGEAWMSQPNTQFAVRTLRALEVLALRPDDRSQLAEVLAVHPRTAGAAALAGPRDGLAVVQHGYASRYASTLRFVALAAQIGARAALAAGCGRPGACASLWPASRCRCARLPGACSPCSRATRTRRSAALRP